MDLIGAGGNVIVHALCENLGDVPLRGVRLQVSRLPQGFSVSPGEQMIDQVAADGGVEKRLLTIRTPEDYDGSVTFHLVATTSETVFESEPVTVGVVAPLPLSLQASASASTVYAGEAVYINVSASNEGRPAAKGVTARLIDVTGNLGVLVQDVGDIGSGESREWVFVVDIPDDFPADVVSSLAVQTVSQDGMTSQTAPISITVVCRPRFEVFVEPLAGRLRGGQSLEAVVLLKNVGQCVAHDISLSLKGLPAAFAQPPEQQVVELAPGGTRYVTFNILIPQAYQGTPSFVIVVADSVGSQTQSLPSSFVVGGVSVVFTVVFGLLALVAVGAMVAGVVLYLRQR